MSPKRQAGKLQQGFSLIEMMVVVLILGIVSAGLFVQIDMAQQRAFSEQIKLDNFQEARDFVDQFFRTSTPGLFIFLVFSFACSFSQFALRAASISSIG